MTLNELRRYAIRAQTAIRYPLANGMECVIDTHGIARIPGLSQPSAVNLDAELANAHAFTLDAPPSPTKRLSRDQLQALTGSAKPPSTHHEEEE
jgi:hypothetical protein